LNVETNQVTLISQFFIEDAPVEQRETAHRLDAVVAFETPTQLGSKFRKIEY
jgi:hypothetical protein